MGNAASSSRASPTDEALRTLKRCYFSIFSLWRLQVLKGKVFLKFLWARIVAEIMQLVQQPGTPTSATNAAAAVPPADGPGGVTPPPPAPAAGGPGGVTSPAPFASFVRQCLKCGEMSHFREGCCLKSKCEGWQYV